jgi:ABC-2 type transport system ATP-binding protein
MTDNQQPAVIVKDLYKSFKLPHEQHSDIKHMVVNFRKRKKGYEVQHVLENISFEIKKGEFFGIVGRNGSGKSTLLKLLAGIYVPDKGLVQINGSLTPFIELGVGFNPELTGRENIFLNGALLGFSRQEMEVMYDDIVDFAELERFMDQKLKNYSSGMQVRLAFSIAIRAQSDILLLDEVLAVGDEAFQRKCFEYFAKLQKAKKTVILVTHDMGAVRRFCTRAVLISAGRIEKVGSPQKIADMYEDLNRPTEQTQSTVGIKPKNQSKYATIQGSIRTVSGKTIKQLYKESTFLIKMDIEPKVDIDNAFVGVVVKKSSGEQIFWTTTEAPNPTLNPLKAGEKTEVLIEMQNIFGDGEYAVDLSIKSHDRTKDYVIAPSAIEFSVSGRGRNGWMLHPDYKLMINKKD